MFAELFSQGLSFLHLKVGFVFKFPDVGNLIVRYLLREIESFFWTKFFRLCGAVAVYPPWASEVGLIRVGFGRARHPGLPKKFAVVHHFFFTRYIFLHKSDKRIV